MIDMCKLKVRYIDIVQLCLIIAQNACEENLQNSSHAFWKTENVNEQTLFLASHWPHMPLNMYL